MGELAELVTSHGGNSATLCAPQVRYTSVNSLDGDACLDWQAQLMMSVAELDGLEVCVGICDFVTVRTGADPFTAELLDGFSHETSVLAPIFDGAWVCDAVQDQFDGMPVSAVVLVISALLTDPLRGHGLGAWMIAEIAHRMLACNDGLLVLGPAPSTGEPDSMRTLEAVERLTQHWCTALGVEAIEGHGGFLGQSTAYVHLGGARDELRICTEVEVSVPVHTLLRCPELQHL